jgi:hypothetical protein
MVAAGAPVALALFFIYLGALSLIPFAAGLFGFSRRIAFVFAATLLLCFVLLEASTFFGQLGYQSPLRLLFVDAFGALVIGVELLLAFVFSHWLGARLRALGVWMVRRIRPS